MSKLSQKTHHDVYIMSTKDKLHPRSLHRSDYNFSRLCAACPCLKKFIYLTPLKKQSIDFTNPEAVKTLNQAILKSDYGLEWDLPDGYLCPPIPGRADYIHYAQDLLGQTKTPPKVLDIGVGAGCIYPLLGYKLYQWRTVGTDIHQASLEHSQKLIDENHLSNSITLRLQPDKSHIFEGIIKDDEYFDLSICNPPFHESAKHAKQAKERKWRNLKKKTETLNFGGFANELYCEGGEVGFITKMIHESKTAPIYWITCLVSKKQHLNELQEELKHLQAKKIKVIPMGQGQKTSHLLAWSFQN